MAEPSLTQRFRSASPRGQISLLIGIAAVAALLLSIAWFFWLRTSYQPLFTKMRPTDAATVLAELDRQKIPYRLADGGTTILIPEAQVDATRLSVMSEDLPLKGTVGFELFNQTDMGITDFAQKINYQRALQGELARTIMTLDGVEAARVHIALGEDRIFQDNRVPPKASVTIRMRAGGMLSSSAAQGIQRLVAAAVPQLDAGNVVILDEAGQIIAGSDAQAAAPVVTSPAAQEKRAVEQYYEARIRAAIARANPASAVRVQVRADLPATAQVDEANLSPTARDFPLQIVVDANRASDTAARAELQGLVVNAVGFDPTLGDSLSFDTLPSPARDVSAAPITRTPPARVAGDWSTEAPAASSPTTSDVPWLLALGTAAVTLVLVLLLGRRSRRTAGLSHEERERFAARLSQAIAGGDRADATR
jgi:flagellar M-ring protein FliF